MSLVDGTSSATFEVTLSQPPTSKLERERRAFARLLPQLLTTHQGQYVTIHEEQVVDSGPTRLEVALRVLQRVGIEVDQSLEHFRRLLTAAAAGKPVADAAAAWPQRLSDPMS